VRLDFAGKVGKPLFQKWAMAVVAEHNEPDAPLVATTGGLAQGAPWKVSLEQETALTRLRELTRGYAPDIDALVTGDLLLSWTHRDRLTQTSPVIVDHTAASIGPEPGVSYIVEVRWVDPDTGVALLPPGVVIDGGVTSSWTLAPDDVSETGAPDRTAEIEVAVRARRLVEGSWLSDREARGLRLTAPFAAGWDRGWGFLWGT